MNGDIHSVSALRYELGQPRPVEDVLAIEEPLQICIDGQPFSITMRLPGADEALATGLMLSEGLIEEFGEIQVFADGRGRVNVLFDKELTQEALNKRNLISVSSCGLCGQREATGLFQIEPLVPLNSPLRLPSPQKMAEAVAAFQQGFKLNGGCHAAALFDEQDLLAVAEDIGRHNAVDKVIGELYRKDELAGAKALWVSGRSSFEIIQKAARAGIYCVISVSAVSSLALKTSNMLNIILVGFAREDRFTLYSHASQVEFKNA